MNTKIGLSWGYNCKRNSITEILRWHQTTKRKEERNQERDQEGKSQAKHKKENEAGRNVRERKAQIAQYSVLQKQVCKLNSVF